ncbi:MAG: SRPBCC family protein [Propionibacteriales bacterium]|nr:SRPBCC family protein [Propionibacteriales bacterium]
MTVLFERTLDSPCAPAAAWAYLVEHRAVPDWLFGVTSFTPVGSQIAGVGATFDVSISLGVTLKSQVQVVAWTEGESAAFESVKGFKNTSVWRVTPTSGGGTRLTVAVSYDLPLGPAGKAMGRVIEPFVVAATNRSVQSLETQLADLVPDHA